MTMNLEGDNFEQKVKSCENQDCEASNLLSWNKENNSGNTNELDQTTDVSDKKCNVTKEASEMEICNNKKGVESMKKCNSFTCPANGKLNNESKNDSEEATFIDTSPNKKCKIDIENEFHDTHVNYEKDLDDEENNIKTSDSVKSNNKGHVDLCTLKEGAIQKSHFKNNSCYISYPKNVLELTEVCSKSSRDQSCFITSQVPDICMKQPCVLGIDEAGRGPVLGPMVYGVCYCPKSKEDDLKETGCADSKTLTEEKREKIFNEICKHSEYIGWEVEVISPNVISTSMLRRSKVSLNEVSHNSAICLLKRTLEAGVMVSEVFVDTVGPPEKYEAKLKNLFPELIITVAKKADATYPIVGGASICAKVTRDVAIKSWTFSQTESSEEWGSGYPNDPVTKKFLTSTMHPIFGFPNIVRFSWSTAEKILEDSAVQVDWENEEGPASNAASVKSFFSTTEKKQHKYFKDRCLKSTVTL